MPTLPIGPKTKAFAIPMIPASDSDAFPISDSAIGETTDAPSTAVQTGTARTGIALWKQIQNYLKTLVDTGVHIDQTTPGTTDSVTVKAAAYGSRQSAARPDDATPYTGGDVVGAAMTFPVGPAAGGEVLITSVALEVDVAAVPSGMSGFTLELYNATPPSALTDNAVWDLPAGDRTAYLGAILVGTPVDLGSTLYIAMEGVNKQVTLLGANLFAYIVTNGGYTPTNSAVKAVTIHTVRL
jgi:hypothetical protein